MDLQESYSEVLKEKDRYKKCLEDIERWLDSQNKIYSKGAVQKAITLLKLSNGIGVK